MISDEVFRTELDNILKRQGFLKKERNALICAGLEYPNDYRNEYLDMQEALARKKEHKEPIPLESQEQKKFVQWWRQTYPNHKILMVRNDGSRTPREKVEQIAMGLHPGVSDLYIPWLKCWIEMKRVKNSVWSDDQKEFKRYVESIGDIYLLCYGCEDAINKILVEVINGQPTI